MTTNKDADKNGVSTAKLNLDKKFAAYVEDNPVDIYVDYNDELSQEQIGRILAGKADDVRSSIEDSYDTSFNDDSWYWDKMAEYLDVSLDDVKEWRDGDDGFYPSCYLDDASWRQLLGNSSAYITATIWEAEYNFGNWAYGAPLEYNDVKEALKVLGVNPYEFRHYIEELGTYKVKGYFPNMPDREPKINMKDLLDNMIVLYDGVLNFCLGDLENVAEVLKDNPENITFKKGTNVVMYDFTSGAGITEVKLIADVTVPRKMLDFRNDYTNNYGIQECYGFFHSYWQEGEICAA